MVKFRVEADLPMDVDAYFADAWGDGPETEGFRSVMSTVLNFRGMDVLDMRRTEDGKKVVRLLTKPNLSLPTAVDAMLARAGGNFELIDTLEFPSRQPKEMGQGGLYHLQFSSMTPLIKGLYEVQGKITVEPIAPNRCRQVLEGTATVNMFGFKYVIEGIIAQQVKSTYEKLPSVVRRWKALKRWKKALELVRSRKVLISDQWNDLMPMPVTPIKHERTITPDSVLEGINESDIESDGDGSGMLTFREWQTPPSSPMSSCSDYSSEGQYSHGFFTPTAHGMYMREFSRVADAGHKTFHRVVGMEDDDTPRDVVVQISMDEEQPSGSGLVSETWSWLSVPWDVMEQVNLVLKGASGGFLGCLPNPLGNQLSAVDEGPCPLMRSGMPSDAGMHSSRSALGSLYGAEGGLPLHRKLIVGTSAVATLFLMMQGLVSIA